MFRRTTSNPVPPAPPTPTRSAAPMTTSGQWELRALLRDLANEPASASEAADREMVIDLREGAATRRC